jgi:hypothetical protein
LVKSAPDVLSFKDINEVPLPSDEKTLDAIYD